MRGNHDGSYEVAHDLAWTGKTWPAPEQLHEQFYDLIVVGAGFGGLASAHFYRERFGADKRILILDNHDDFGGHAKRNEFTVNGQTLIGYGGSQSLDAPSSYSPAVKSLLDAIGVEPAQFYDFYDQSYFSDRSLVRKVFFDAAHYGEDRLVDYAPPFYGEAASGPEVKAALAQFPISQEGRDALYALLVEPRDYLAGRSYDEKRRIMRSTSYEDFVRDYAGVPEDGLIVLRKVYLGIWAVGWDVLSALEGVRLGMPGLSAIGVAETHGDPDAVEEPRIFHFPDGNAGVARMLVRHLLPRAIAGETMEDIVTAPVDYSALDQAENAVRLRLSSTAIKVANGRDDAGGDYVDVTYVHGGTAYKVRGAHAVLGCYGHVVPHICPDLSEAQADALRYPEKTPLVYINVAVRNWRAFDRAGASRIYCPQGFYNTIRLDYPVSMGGYDFTDNPDQPAVLTLQYIPIQPGKGRNMKQQSREGRRALYRLTFADFERELTAQLDAALGPYGFDAEADIAAITVNRWPHGYAYEYNELEDDWSFDSANGPHIAGRQPIGRIHLANSDNQASAYLNAAVEAADRAIGEIAGTMT